MTPPDGRPDRRSVLAGVSTMAATATAPFALAATSDGGLARLLDRVAATLAPPPGGSPWKLGDETAGAAEQRFLAPGRALAQLRAFNASGLTARERLDLDTVRSGLEIEAELASGFPFGAAPGRPFVVDARAGGHLSVRNGLAGPAPTATTLDAYLDALEHLARNLDGETTRLTRDAAEWRVILPHRYLADVEARLRGLAAVRTGDCALVKAAPVEARGRVEATFETLVRPALARQAEALARLLPLAPEGGGARSWRGGEHYHVLALKAGLGLDLGPEQADRSARAEANRLTAELDGLLREEGLRDGAAGARLRRLMADPAGLYPDTGAGRDRAVAEMNAVLARAQTHLAALHPAPPPGPFAVHSMAPADEARARAGYRTATATGGVYVADLHAIRDRPAWTLATVVCHETLPGHLLQLPLQTAAKPHPLRVRYATGYFEGWGVYAESLGDGLELYDRRARIGYLQSMLFRLSRAIADVGVHRHGWTPERAKVELASLYGFGLFNSLDVEVERLFLAPGAGGADAFGRLEILRLRQAWPGDLASFHAAILDNGPYPLRLLGRAVKLSAKGATGSV